MDYDIIIIGSGVVGCTLACLLASSELRIAIVDQKAMAPWEQDKYNMRVSALTLGSANILQNIGVFDVIAKKRIAPYQNMFVWDNAGRGEIEFSASNIGKPQLGYIVENNLIQNTLLEKIHFTPNIDVLCPIHLTAAHFNHPEGVTLEQENGKSLTSRLVIGADGAKSWLRQQANIDINSQSYEHHAIVTTVKTEHPHNKTAWQRFLADGPLAFLPLNEDNLCSIVWSLPAERADTLLSLSTEEFNNELSQAFEYRLGNVSTLAKPVSFPLTMRHSKHYVKPNLALVGDAIHTIHPLAGLGMNLGMLDAHELANTLLTANNNRKDFASLATLRKYERARKGHTLFNLMLMQSFKKLFTTQTLPVILARNVGLRFCNHTPLLKQLFTHFASMQTS